MRGKPQKYKADSICSAEGCNCRVMEYKRHGVVRYRKFCFKHYSEYKKQCKKNGFSLSYEPETKADEEKAREWNKKHPFHGATLLAFMRGMQNMSRIPSGGKCNKSNIEGE